MSRAVNIGDLRRERVLLEIGCAKCAHHSYLDPRDLPFDDMQPVPTAFQRMKCSVCGERGSYTRPDPRLGGVNGQYPRF